MRMRIAAVSALCALIATSAAAQRQYVMAGGAVTGSITVSGGSTLRSWSCDVTRFDATVQSRGEVGTLPSGRESASFTIPVAGIDCRNGTMNNHLREALDGERHPNIRFELQRYTLVDGATLRAQGNLTVGGRTTPIEVEARYEPASGALRVVGEKRLRMTELGVEPPSLMFGTLKVHDPITIAFDLAIQQSAVSLAMRSAAGRR